MRRFIITCFSAIWLVTGWQQARAFALLGPPVGMAGLPATYEDSWQVEDIGYAPGEGLVGDPKQYQQGYRRNAPVMYYAFDTSFSSFFGVDGEDAGDSAMNILNNTFTNNSGHGLDGYSYNLTEFPFNSQTINTTAEGLGLTDVKSVILYLMMEQLGLAQPETYTWTLADRYLPSIPGYTCPFFEEYLVVQRNFAINPTPADQLQYSAYVNNTLYSYWIEEVCSGPPVLAITWPYAVDPFAQSYTAVAGLGTGLGVLDITVTNIFGEEVDGAPESGGFYNGLTSDDVAGLRYLMSTNEIQFEDPTIGSFLENTNFSSLLLLQTSDLGTLLQYAQTNPPAAVIAFAAAQNPPQNITINSYSNYYTVISNPIVYSYFTNLPGSPVGGPPTFVVGTNGYTYLPETNYVYTFGNVVPVNYYTNSVATILTTSIVTRVGSPVGTGTFTNFSVSQIVLTNVPSGDYYALPTNSCGFDFVATLRSNNVAGFTISNVITSTNVVATNSTGFNGVASQTILTYFTNNWLEYYSCNLQTNGPEYFRGIGSAQFVRVPDNNFDSLTGNLRIPITNTYTMVWWNPTNSQTGSQTFQRVLATPDFLFSGEDLAAPNNGVPGAGNAIAARNVNFDINNIPTQQAGPGIINPPSVIYLNAVGDVFYNGTAAFDAFNTNGFLTQMDGGHLLAWASFNGTTNAPEVYPNGTSIQELENQLVVTITPSSLPNGTNGVAYPTISFSATGGQPPYTWQLVTSGTQALPTGLSFYNGILAGTPFDNSPGTYDFTIQLTDQDNRVVALPYSITITY